MACMRKYKGKYVRLGTFGLIKEVFEENPIKEDKDKLYIDELEIGDANKIDIIELSNIMDEIEFNEIGMRQKIKEEIERHKKFQSGLLGIKEIKVTVKDVEIRNYAKYILREGQMHEKRELLGCLRSNLMLAQKIVSI
jgi:hypothetical protein